MATVLTSEFGVCYGDWIQGASFNFLGLEVGQYYTDYLRETFEENYLIAYWIKKSLSCFKTLNSATNHSDDNQVIVRFLNGHEFNDSYRIS